VGCEGSGWLSVVAVILETDQNRHLIYVGYPGVRRPCESDASSSSIHTRYGGEAMMLTVVKGLEVT
jgi:hypothetical protein